MKILLILSVVATSVFASPFAKPNHRALSDSQITEFLEYITILKNFEEKFLFYYNTSFDAYTAVCPSSPLPPSFEFFESHYLSSKTFVNQVSSILTAIKETAVPTGILDVETAMNGILEVFREGLSIFEEVNSTYAPNVKERVNGVQTQVTAVIDEMKSCGDVGFTVAASRGCDDKLDGLIDTFLLSVAQIMQIQIYVWSVDMRENVVCFDLGTTIATVTNTTGKMKTEAVTTTPSTVSFHKFLR